MTATARTAEDLAQDLIDSVDLDVETATDAVDAWIHGGYAPADYPTRTSALLRLVTPRNGYDVLAALEAR